nr:MAG: protein of unknown function DUF5604 [Bacteriophage sp.]
MVFGKIKPVATIVAQFAAGVEVECIQHEGKMFMPVIAGDFDTVDDGKKVEDSPAPKKSAPKPAPQEEEAADEKVYTEDELMDMDVKELTKILKNDFKINPDDFDGKNTNKKLRNLILDAQEKGGDNSSDAEAEDEKPAPKKGKSKPAKEEEEPADEDDGDELIDNIADVLEDFDGGKKNKKKAAAAIIALAENEDDVDADAVNEALTEFEDDEAANIDDVAESIAKLLTSKKSKTSAKSKKKPAEPEGEDVEIDDLEKGDLVAVYWDDEETKGWFNGKVSSIKKGIVKVKYDDGSEDELDPEVHTKIRRLEE